MKLCEECFCRAANIHLMQITGAAQQSVFLCEECARKHGISISFDDSPEERIAVEECAPEKEPDDRVCSVCGMKFAEYAGKGRLGCPSCYSAFESDVTALQRRFDDADDYRGKRYRQEMPHMERNAQDDLVLLQNELESAVRNEQFERAAFLRDAINHLDEAGRE